MNFMLIGEGAEAKLYLIDFFGRKAVLKVRPRKRYRNPKLDERLRIERTRSEALNMIRAYNSGIRVPLVFNVNLLEKKIVMEFIDGKLLRDAINEGEAGEGEIKEAGRLLALLHKINVAHGDYTTSNIMVNEDGLVIIDFGLSKYTKDPLEKAIDIVLMIRSLKSAHYGKGLEEAFWDGYLSVGDEEMRRYVKRIEVMGRYVSRRSVWEGG